MASATANRDAAADTASHALLNSLTAEGKEYDAPIMNLYATTMFLLAFIHVLFIYQLVNRRTKDHISTSYRRIVLKKQFYRAILALLSHPPISTLSPNEDQVPVEVEMGDDDTRPSPRRIHGLTREHGSLRYFSSKLKGLMDPFINGIFSGLPLLAYISHIIWQCRPLEEIYDYSYDKRHAYHHPKFNMTTVLDADKVLHTYFQTQTSHGKESKEDQSFVYYRVLLVLALTALFTHLLLTHYLVTFTRQRRRPALGDRLMDDNYCTLTSLATALVVIYTAHFPYTPISVMPLVDISLIRFSWSSLGFILICGILTLLSFRTSNVTGVFHGGVSGLLWVNGWTTFLATRYWGNWFMVLMVFACAASYKIEYQSIRHEGRYRSAIDLLPCIESVLWNGHESFNESPIPDIVLTFSRD
jgi:hypothetical protein